MSVVTILPEATCKHLKANATNTPTNSLKSMDSIYSATPSSKFSTLSRRKGIQKSRDRNNPMSLVPVASEIKQRVTSARMLRMKQLQNQIGEAHHRISELAAENRLLKSLHKRQDSALSKYENTSAELPQLLNSHAEELRMWQTRCRNLQRQNKDLTSKVKQKDTIILTLSDQNKQLLTLNKDKSLLERANLQERVKDLELRVAEKESEIKLIARRLQLEAKSFRSNLQMEQQKYRDLLIKFEMSDFLLSRDNNNKKQQQQPSLKTTAKLIRNLSPSNRLTSKSATSLSTITVNEPATSSDQNLLRVSTPPTILPPCDGSENNSNKKMPESIKNNSPSVNSNVQLMPESHQNGYHSNEINLAKNSIDKSEKMPAINGHVMMTEDHEDLTTLNVKNGMTRARREQNMAKLAPINAQTNNNSNNNKINDSEFSDEDDDEDDDLHFFSNHNGTMAASHHHQHHNNNNKINLNTKNHAKDLLDHKMHINQLENQMRRNSLDLNSSESSSTTPETIKNISNKIIKNNNSDVISYNDRGDSEIMTIRRHDTQRESLLDDLCDSLADKSSHYSSINNNNNNNSSSSTKTTTYTRIKKLEFIEGGSQNINNSNGNSYEAINGNNHIKSNGIAINANNNINAGRLDDKKKNKLLAALKHIDNGSSFEN